MGREDKLLSIFMSGSVFTLSLNITKDDVTRFSVRGPYSRSEGKSPCKHQNWEIKDKRFVSAFVNSLWML